MIIRLAHVEMGATDLERARHLYVDLLGFVEHARDADALYLRGVEEFDLWSLKITKADSGGIFHSSFRVDDPDDLERLRKVHAAKDLPAEILPAGAEPGQGEALRCRTGEGHAVEFFHEFEEIDPIVDGRLLLPMRRGTHGAPPTRLDHVSLRVPDLESAIDYWVGDLDFSASELWIAEDGKPRIAWVRRQPNSHDVALGQNETAAFHHIAYSVSDSIGLQRAADVLGDARLQGQLEFGPSRHGATNAFAMYIRDDDGNRLELYCGDYFRDLDRPPLEWHPHDYANQGHSWWGHPPPPTFAETNPLLGDWV